MFRLTAEIGEKFGFRVVRARLGGETFAEEIPASRSWQVRIPLAEDDFVELERSGDSGSPTFAAGLFLDALQTGLFGRSKAFVSLKRQPELAVRSPI